MLPLMDFMYWVFYRFTTVSNDGLFTSLNKGNDDDV